MRTVLSRIINSDIGLLLSFLFLLFTSSVLYSLSEGTSLLDGFWWFGYGDTFPHHLLGKIVAVCLMLSMVLLIIPAITARMASGLIVNHDAFTHEEQEDIKNKIDNILKKIGDI